jgi:hypothetical protein
LFAPVEGSDAGEGIENAEEGKAEVARSLTPTIMTGRRSSLNPRESDWNVILPEEALSAFV